MAPAGDDHYHPKDAVSVAVKAGAVTGAAGVFMAAIQNALAKEHVGAWAVLSRGGGIIVSMAAVGGIYEFSRTASANLREKEDPWNTAIGGFLGGAVLGLRTLRMPPTLGMGAVTAAVMAAADFTGGLSGHGKPAEMDEFERKEQLRLNRRRPIEETIAEIGEGRGIRPPGYEERRRERLKEKYGIDINPVSADPNAA